MQVRSPLQVGPWDAVLHRGLWPAWTTVWGDTNLSGDPQGR